MDLKTKQELNQFLDQLKSCLTNEEYIRINYKLIIDSIVKCLLRVDVQTCEQLLLNQLSDQLTKTLDYNRRHPSPQRMLCFVDYVQQLTAKVGINYSQQISTTVLNNQNVLMKTMKVLLKDSNSDDYNTETIVTITDTLLKTLESIRVLTKSEAIQSNSNSVIVLNNLILNTIRCIYILMNNFKYNILSIDLNRFCGQLLGILKLYCFYGTPGYDISKVNYHRLIPSPFIQTNGIKSFFY